ncbi:putative serine/threonine-protein phosphatase 4 regulatory subunit 1-like [Bos indicus x Bos taurus]|uniref:putative serine/threonine-protein phosphatase 4 regulatory subunit 1-like n=1 Tax=Bos indicus x Bos taurus TaxID=30522 RepID=UPI000F7D32C3|nr:putative serine/threonine-protein phosphatase 4 regulatory subunit 1-like [Bos indicus x Bos taurus]
MTWTIMDLRTMALKNCNGMRVTAFLDTWKARTTCLPSLVCRSMLFQQSHLQLVMAQGLLDIFMDFSNNEEDFLTVMGIMVRLSEDSAQVQGLSAARRAAQPDSVNKA